MYICYKQSYSKIFSRFKTIIYLFLIWFIGYQSSLPINLSIGVKYDENVSTCLWSHTSNRLNTHLIAILAYILPCILIGFFYLKIFQKTITIRENTLNSHYLNLSLRFSKCLFCSFFLLIITYLIFSLILIIDFDIKLSNHIFMFGYVGMKINSFLNPILYATGCSLFWKGYKNFIYLIFNRKNYSYSIVQKELAELIEIELE